jgi:hypothetical protein
MHHSSNHNLQTCHCKIRKSAKTLDPSNSPLQRIITISLPQCRKWKRHSLHCCLPGPQTQPATKETYDLTAASAYRNQCCNLDTCVDSFEIGANEELNDQHWMWQTRDSVCFQGIQFFLQHKLLYAVSVVGLETALSRILHCSNPASLFQALHPRSSKPMMVITKT